MGITKSYIAKHIVIIIGITAILCLCIVYPFLPGKYDKLAMPLSIMIQILGSIGLLISVVGFLWLLIPKYYYVFGITTLLVSTFIIAILAFIALLSEGKVLAVSIIIIWVLVFLRLKINLSNANKTGQNRFSFIPVYLVILPIFILIMQLTFAKPITRWSRNRAIENANQYLSDLRVYHEKYGHYPVSLQAMHNDYDPQITGIEKYHYLQYGDSYNISFEQPRFIFDVFGTREWVVYNPKDEQRAYSHTSWFILLSPVELERTQGWYTSGDTEHLHWKYFFFD